MDWGDTRLIGLEGVLLATSASLVLADVGSDGPTLLGVCGRNPVDPRSRPRCDAGLVSFWVGAGSLHCPPRQALRGLSTSMPEFEWRQNLLVLLWGVPRVGVCFLWRPGGLFDAGELVAILFPRDCAADGFWADVLADRVDSSPHAVRLLDPPQRQTPEARRGQRNSLGSDSLKPMNPTPRLCLF